MIESTLYGQMYGMPIVRMSVWPFDLDELLLVHTFAVVIRCTASTSPACTLVIWCGASDRLEDLARQPRRACA